MLLFTFYSLAVEAKEGMSNSSYLKNRLVRLLFSAGTVFFSHNNLALAYFFSQFQPSERGHSAKTDAMRKTIHVFTHQL